MSMSECWGMLTAARPAWVKDPDPAITLATTS